MSSTSNVRGEQAAWLAPERMVFGQGLRFGHIKACAENAILIQGLRQSHAIHGISPACIDQHGGGLHQSKTAAIDDVPGLRR